MSIQDASVLSRSDGVACMATIETGNIVDKGSVMLNLKNLYILRPSTKIKTKVKKLQKLHSKNCGDDTELFCKICQYALIGSLFAFPQKRTYVVFVDLQSCQEIGIVSNA